MFDLIRRTFMIPRAPRVLSDQARFDHLETANEYLEHRIKHGSPEVLDRLSRRFWADQPLLAISIARAAAQREVAIDLERCVRKLASPRSDGLYEIRMFGRVPVIARVFRLSPLPPSVPMQPTPTTNRRPA
jgi:hypothetical protein